MKEFPTQDATYGFLPTRIVLQRPRHRMEWQRARGLWSQSCLQLPRRSFATVDCGRTVLSPIWHGSSGLPIRLLECGRFTRWVIREFCSRGYEEGSHDARP
jgi:hypothetical protein